MNHSCSSESESTNFRRAYRETALDNTNRDSNRSTLPLNSFYGDFINKLKFRKTQQIEEMLKDKTEMFYLGIDEMDKTVLHIACEKNIFEVVKLILTTLFDGEQP